jgi:hypothetical protein
MRRVVGAGDATRVELGWRCPRAASMLLHRWRAPAGDLPGDMNNILRAYLQIWRVTGTSPGSHYEHGIGQRGSNQFRTLREQLTIELDLVCLILKNRD